MEYFVEGWTTPIDYQLKKNDLPFDATGTTVETELRDKNGTVVAEAGSTAWLDPVLSKVRYTPSAADLTAARSPMKVRFKVTAGGQVAWFPRSSNVPSGYSAEEWIVGLP
jgi:hypothetical protein